MILVMNLTHDGDGGDHGDAGVPLPELVWSWLPLMTVVVVVMVSPGFPLPDSIWS
mgnify:CR=1 FL=1